MSIKSRERELVEALRVGELGGNVTQNGTKERLDDGVFRHEYEKDDQHGHGASATDSAVAVEAATGLVGEQERLLRAVDNGDPDL